MTPNKSKKPLPSSTSIIIPEPEGPQTSREWRTALQRVKLLYLKNQWKQCVARCDGLLRIDNSVHPLYAAFLHFYSALSNEAIARSTHNLSATKIPLLEHAKRSYQAASRIMPELEDPIDDRRQQQRQRYNTTTNYRLSSPSSASSSGVSTPRPSPPASPFYPSSASSTDSISDVPIEPTPKTKPLTPSPSVLSNITVSPATAAYSYTTSSSLTPTTKRRLRPSPLRITPPTTRILAIEPTTPPAQMIPSDLSTLTCPLSITFSASSTIWLQNRSMDRYHTHLIALANMLIEHIEVVEGLMQSAEEAQAKRPTLKRFVSMGSGLGAGDDEEKRKVELRARVERLKARGWRRERFAPERYQELCARALQEL